MKNGIWHPADFDGKNAGEEKTKEKTAVAIAYEPGERAPKILATGKGYLADKIIEKAKEEDVPLYQDNQLANTLSRLEIGDMIPPELYEVVAEILVFVDDMDKLMNFFPFNSAVNWNKNSCNGKRDSGNPNNRNPNSRYPNSGNPNSRNNRKGSRDGK